MTDYLTPAELHEWADELERTYPPGNKCAPTLRACAELAWSIACTEPAMSDGMCAWCLAGLTSGDEHSDTCLWLRARKLAGVEGVNNEVRS